MKKNGKGSINNKKGVTAVEYALIAALIALAIITGIKTLGSTVNNKLLETATTIENTTE